MSLLGLLVRQTVANWKKCEALTEGSIDSPTDFRQRSIKAYTSTGTVPVQSVYLYSITNEWSKYLYSYWCSINYSMKSPSSLVYLWMLVLTRIDTLVPFESAEDGRPNLTIAAVSQSTLLSLRGTVSTTVNGLFIPPLIRPCLGPLNLL